MNMPILNKLLGRFDFRKKHNRTDLNIQAVDQLREAMESKGIRQKDIAEKLGISPAAVSKTLSMSEKNLELNTIADFATAMELRFSLSLAPDPHCADKHAAIKKELKHFSYSKAVFNNPLLDVDTIRDINTLQNINTLLDINTLRDDKEQLEFGEFREISVSLKAEGV
ncbi:helix-turn-helix domain-containing protein [Neisseria sp. DTU_2020_1000833_1_SI_GRL_NUU_006]|nr:helix-turn-helix domain-containing protein [Neisseria sp. DTU_2020_1000833_1_SI_GRL_NUU_006]